MEDNPLDENNIKPELIGKALTAAVKWAADHGETTSAGQITAALTSVADDLRAEGANGVTRESDVEECRGILINLGLSEGASETIVNHLLNAGILFEERRR